MPNSVYLEGLVAGLRANGDTPANPYEDDPRCAHTWVAGYESGVAMRGLIETRVPDESEGVRA